MILQFPGPAPFLATHSPLGEPADPRRDWARAYAQDTGRSLFDGLAVYDNAKHYALRIGGVAADEFQDALILPGRDPYSARAEAFQAAERAALAAALADPTIMGLPEIHSSPLRTRTARKATRKLTAKERLDYA